MKTKPIAIAEDRALQILNNVAEEFWDDGLTNFATKTELCATIMWLRAQHENEFQRMRKALGQVVTIAAKAMFRQ